MILDEGQKQKVAAWIKEGLKLSEIQSRLASDLGIRLTYMEVRLLVNDLDLTPKDPEPVKSTIPIVKTPADLKPESPVADSVSATASKGVSITIDQIARPGAVVSGRVTFSDGNKAEWYLDQGGRLGLIPKQAGYQPSRSDLQEFQRALETELNKLGF